MVKTILIPTDYSIESLHLVKQALSNLNEGEQCNLVLAHGLHAGDSISDLLFFSKNKLIQSFTNSEFEEACTVIRNKFQSQIKSLRKDVILGKTQSAFNNYLEANGIDEAYIPLNHKLSYDSKKCFDIVPLIEKSKLNVEELSWRNYELSPERGTLAEVMFNTIATS